MSEGSDGVRFKLFGVPVLIRPSFWIVAVLLGLNGAGRLDADGILIITSWVSVMTVSILIHEFGHAAAMSVYKFRPTIELHSMGGLAHFGSSGRLTRKAAVIVSLAGPAAGLLVGLLMLPVYLSLTRDSPFALRVFATHWVYVNIAWSVFNLLPVLPMDGGRVAEDLLSTRPKAWQRARILSVVTAVLCAIAAVIFMDRPWFIVLMLLYFAGYSFSQLKEQRATSMLRRPPID